MYSPWLNTLDNGIRSLFWESPFTRIATVQCFFPGGKRLESPKNAGISQLIAHQLLLDHHDFLEELGSAITVEVEADYFVISGKCLGEDLGELLTFLGNLLPRIHFNSHTLAKVKTEFIDRINEQQYNPFHCAYEQLQPLIYGNHPYGLDAWGTIASLDLLQIEDLQQHYDRFLSPRHLTVAITANSAPIGGGISRKCLWALVVGGCRPHFRTSGSRLPLRYRAPPLGRSANLADGGFPRSFSSRSGFFCHEDHQCPFRQWFF